MDDNLEHAAEEANDSLNQAADNAWKAMDDAAEQTQGIQEEAAGLVEEGKEQVSEVAQEAEAVKEKAAGVVEGGWQAVNKVVEPTTEKVVEVKDEFMQASAESWSKEVPAEPAKEPEPVEADRWGTPAPAASEDANRWTSEIYSPEAEPVAKPAEPVIVEAKPVGTGLPPAGVKASEPAKKGKFPTWAIVLIVLFVLCICIACPLLVIFSGALDWVRNSSMVVPFLM